MREWRVADLERRKQMEEAAAARGDTEFAKSIAKWEVRLTMQDGCSALRDGIASFRSTPACLSPSDTLGSVHYSLKQESVRQRQRDDEERRRMQVLKDKHDILAQTAAYKAQIEAKKKARVRRGLSLLIFYPLRWKRS